MWNNPKTHKLEPVMVADPVRVWSVADGHEIASYKGQIRPVRSLQWSPRHDLIAFTGADNTVHLWNPDLPQDRETVYHLRHAVMALAYSPDGTRLAVCNGDHVTVLPVPSEHQDNKQ